MHRALVIALVFLLPTAGLVAQDERAPRKAWEVFRPMALPTPNVYRSASGVPGPAYWQQKVDYQIKASLDEETRRLQGEEVITYTNASPHSLNYLWMSFDQNLFRADSLAKRMSGRRSRAGRGGATQGFEIQSIQCEGADLEYEVYDTLARVECNEAIDPNGGEIRLKIRWSIIVPKPGMRMGVTDHGDASVFALANWFPAVAVFDDVNGWNTLPYIGRGEFYQEFGSYDVSLTVPRSHVVCATGELKNAGDVMNETQFSRWKTARKSSKTTIIRGLEEAKKGSDRPEGDGPLTWHFKANHVRTFAWSSSPAFLWDASGLAGTMMQSFYPPDALPLWKDSTAMLRTAIAGFSKRWFQYPYPSASSVNALGSGGGMEYPMIIFNGRERSEKGLYFLIAHEIGHQWFPMIVNSDERRHPWMDEGFNTFIDYYAMLDHFGEAGRQFGLRTWHMMERMTGEQPISTPPDQGSGSAVGFNAYFKPARVMIMLRECVLGPKRFDRAFRDYIAAWSFKHPKPADFFRCMESGAGMDLDWFFREWIDETYDLDQGVEKAKVSGKGKRSRIRITFRNHGRAVMPLFYRIEFKEGESMEGRVPVQVWSRSDKHTVTIPLNGRTPTKVQVDPKKVYPDFKRDNNRIEVN